MPDLTATIREDPISVCGQVRRPPLVLPPLDPTGFRSCRERADHEARCRKHCKAAGRRPHAYWPELVPPPTSPCLDNCPVHSPGAYAAEVRSWRPER